MARATSTPRGMMAALAVTALSSGAQAPVVGPEFTARIDGRAFEPTTALAQVDRTAAGTSVRVFVDEVESTCDELDEVHGRRIVIGPFPYRPGRTLPASTAGAMHVRLDPDGRVRASAFASGTILVRVGDRDAPALALELALDLDDTSTTNSMARGDVFVTPCVLPLP